MKSFKQFISEALDVTDNPNFKRWFGNSKVVNEQGNPLVVYHGSSEDFTYFDTRTRGGAYFTIDSDEARQYARSAVWASEDDEDEDNKKSENVYAVYLRIENPFNPDDPDHKASIDMDADCVGEWEDMQRYARQIKAAGYDGMLVREHDDDTVFDYVVFSSTQIKSADKNNGNFDPRYDNIYK